MSRALILLAPGFEEIEAMAVIDILKRANVDVVSAGIQPGVIISSHGVKIVPDIYIDMAKADGFDMLILPGGMPGTTNLNNDARVKVLILDFYNTDKYIGAICAAPYVLSEAGILQDKSATSYPSMQSNLKAKHVIQDQKVVQDGKIITSQGPATAIDFALALAVVLEGNDKVQEIRTGILYQ